MGKFEIFLFAFFSGIITRSGFITIEQLIWSAWDSASYSLLFFLAPDLHGYVLLVGVVVFCIIAYFILEPFIFGWECGFEGVGIAILGFIAGVLLMGFLINEYDVMIGLPT